MALNPERNIQHCSTFTKKSQKVLCATDANYYQKSDDMRGIKINNLKHCA